MFVRFSVLIAGAIGDAVDCQVGYRNPQIGYAIISKYIVHEYR